jgi:hypothetical protein
MVGLLTLSAANERPGDKRASGSARHNGKDVASFPDQPSTLARIFDIENTGCEGIQGNQGNQGNGCDCSSLAALLVGKRDKCRMKLPLRICTTNELESVDQVFRQSKRCSLLCNNSFKFPFFYTAGLSKSQAGEFVSPGGLMERWRDDAISRLSGVH